MQLKEFTLISPVVESGMILKALETAIPSAAIEKAIEYPYRIIGTTEGFTNTFGHLSDH